MCGKTFKQTAQGLSKGCQMKKANFLLFFKNPIKKQTLKTFPKTESNLVMENKFLLCCNTSSQREFEIQKIEGRSKILFLEKKSIASKRTPTWSNENHTWPRHRLQQEHFLHLFQLKSLFTGSLSLPHIYLVPPHPILRDRKCLRQ